LDEVDVVPVASDRLSRVLTRSRRMRASCSELLISRRHLRCLTQPVLQLGEVEGVPDQAARMIPDQLDRPSADRAGDEGHGLKSAV
jgi:hypothetical protein